MTSLLAFRLLLRWLPATHLRQFVSDRWDAFVGS